MGPANFREYWTNWATPPRVIKNMDPSLILPLWEYMYRMPPRMATMEMDTLLIRLMLGKSRAALYSAL